MQAACSLNNPRKRVTNRVSIDIFSGNATMISWDLGVECTGQRLAVVWAKLNREYIDVQCSPCFHATAQLTRVVCFAVHRWMPELPARGITDQPAPGSGGET